MTDALCPRPFAAIVVGLSLAAALPAQAAGGCKPRCALASTVVNAAGIPDGITTALKKLQFDRDGLAAADAATLKSLAAAFKTLPPLAVVTLQVAADRGLQGAAASRQASARAQALRQALTAAGVPASQFKLQTGL